MLAKLEQSGKELTAARNEHVEVLKRVDGLVERLRAGGAP